MEQSRKAASILPGRVLQEQSTKVSKWKCYLNIRWKYAFSASIRLCSKIYSLEHPEVYLYFENKIWFATLIFNLCKYLLVFSYSTAWCFFFPLSQMQAIFYPFPPAFFWQLMNAVLWISSDLWQDIWNWCPRMCVANSVMMLQEN